MMGKRKPQITFEDNGDRVDVLLAGEKIGSVKCVFCGTEAKDTLPCRCRCGLVEYRHGVFIANDLDDCKREHWIIDGPEVS